MTDNKEHADPEVVNRDDMVTAAWTLREEVSRRIAILERTRAMLDEALEGGNMVADTMASGR